MFNIYLEHVLDELVKKLNFKYMWYRAYADDLVIIVKHILLRPTIRNLISISEKYNLHLNAKKSNWIKIKKHKGTSYTLKETFDIAQANRYTYLGVSIDQSGKIDYD